MSNPDRDHPSPLVQLAYGLEDIEADQREIEILRKEMKQIAQMVHQAYHGAHPPDLSNVTWEKCSRGICRRAQITLDPDRKRGQD